MKVSANISGPTGTKAASTTSAGRGRREAGLTTPEILMVLLIMALLVATAGPSLSGLVKKMRLKTEADRVMTSLNHARSEAIKWNGFVSLCRSDNGSACTGDWEDGWVVFRDVDGDGSVDSGDGDTVLAVHAGLPGDLTFGSDISQNYLSYFADGSYSGGAGSIRLCSSDRDLENAWTIHQSTVGRPRISKGASVCP